MVIASAPARRDMHAFRGRSLLPATRSSATHPGHVRHRVGKRSARHGCYRIIYSIFAAERTIEIVRIDTERSSTAVTPLREPVHKGRQTPRWPLWRRSRNRRGGG